MGRFAGRFSSRLDPQRFRGRSGDGRGPGGGGSPFVSLADVAVQLDFVNDRYYWDGAWRARGDFTAFTLSGGCSMTSSGLVLDGTAANFTINIAWASLNISTPLAMIASFSPASGAASNRNAVSLNNGATNRAWVGFASTGAVTGQVITANVTVASLTTGTITVGTRVTTGMGVETNNVLQSVNGATGAAADTSAALFTPTNLAVGVGNVSTHPFIGTIHHIAIFTGTHDQTLLNTRTGLVTALFA